MATLSTTMYVNIELDDYFDVNTNLMISQFQNTSEAYAITIRLFRSLISNLNNEGIRCYRNIMNHTLGLCFQTSEDILLNRNKLNTLLSLTDELVKNPHGNGYLGTATVIIHNQRFYYTRHIPNNEEHLEVNDDSDSDTTAINNNNDGNNANANHDWFSFNNASNTRSNERPTTPAARFHFASYSHPLPKIDKSRFPLSKDRDYLLTNDCPICLDSLLCEETTTNAATEHKDTQIVNTSCNHEFHFKCLNTHFESTRLLSRYNRCPMCRTHVQSLVPIIVSNSDPVSTSTSSSSSSSSSSSTSSVLSRGVVYIQGKHRIAYPRQNGTYYYNMNGRRVTISSDTPIDF